MTENEFVEIVNKLKQEKSFNISISTEEGLNLSASKTENASTRPAGFNS